MRLKHHHLATAISTTRTCATPVYRRDGRNMETNVVQLHRHRSTRDETAGVQGSSVSPLYRCQFDGPGDENDLANIIQEFDEFAMEN